MVIAGDLYANTIEKKLTETPLIKELLVSLSGFIIAAKELAYAVDMLAVVIAVVDDIRLRRFIAAAFYISAAFSGGVGFIPGEMVGLAAVVAGDSFHIRPVSRAGAAVAL